MLGSHMMIQQSLCEQNDTTVNGNPENLWAAKPDKARRFTPGTFKSDKHVTYPSMSIHYPVHRW